MTYFWGKFDIVVVHFEFWLLFPIWILPDKAPILASIGDVPGIRVRLFGINKPGLSSSSSSLLLRVRFSRFTNVFSLAVEDLVSLLGSIILTTLVGLGTSSFGRASSLSSHYILNEENY
jgi:hypothetical protein